MDMSQVAELKAIHQQAAVGGGGPIAAPSAFAAAAAASDMPNKRNGASEPTITRAGGLTGEQVCVITVMHVMHRMCMNLDTLALSTE
jgi:hypothetical protein